MSLTQDKKVYSGVVLQDYVKGTQTLDVLDTDTSVAEGSVSSTSTSNSTIASIVVAAGQRIIIKRVLMTNEGSANAAHYDLYNKTSSAIIEPMGYLASPGNLERVGTFKDPVTAFTNSGASSVTIALTISAPNSSNTYTGSMRYSILYDDRPPL